MKKLSFVLLTMTSIASASAFAELSKAELAGYTSSQRSHASLSATAPLLYATDLTIINATVGVLHSIVPGSRINDVNSPETNDHIRHETMTGKTHINLRNDYGNEIFDKFVCRLAVVTAYGMPGSYRVTVDEEYCNRP